MKQLKEDLQSACADRDTVVCERALDSELERMQSNIHSLTEERDQLQEIVQSLREEKSQLKIEMEEKDEMVRAVFSNSSSFSIRDKIHICKMARVNVYFFCNKHYYYYYYSDHSLPVTTE